jgi:hypothetical protein
MSKYVRIHCYVLKLKGGAQAKIFGWRWHKWCVFHISLADFLWKMFCSVPNVFLLLEKLFCLQCIKSGLSLLHVSVFCCLEFIFIFFIFTKTKLQIIVENRYWSTSIVNSSTVIKHYIMSRNKMCEKFCSIFCARKMMYIFLILV